MTPPRITLEDVAICFDMGAMHGLKSELIRRAALCRSAERIISAGNEVIELRNSESQPADDVMAVYTELDEALAAHDRLERGQ
jgi:hypothetical protein